MDRGSLLKWGHEVSISPYFFTPILNGSALKVCRARIVILVLKNLCSFGTVHCPAPQVMGASGGGG